MAIRGLHTVWRFFTFYLPACIWFTIYGLPDGARNMEAPEQWRAWLRRMSGKRIAGSRWAREYFEEDPSTTIHLVGNIRVSSICHYKKVKNKSQHEFVVAHLVDLSSGDEPTDEPLYLRYERNGDPPGGDVDKWTGAQESLRFKKMVANRPKPRTDAISLLLPEDIRDLKREVKKGKTVLLKFVSPN
jgi:hypothetical protein